MREACPICARELGDFRSGFREVTGEMTDVVLNDVSQGGLK